MSQENRTRVNKIMDDALRHGLRHFIFRQYTAKFGKGIDLDEMGRVLYRELKTKETTLEELDIQAWLKLMDRNWETVFRKKLSYTPRGYVNELRDVRNQNSHKNDLSTFTNEETYRIATTAIKLLEAIDKSGPSGDTNAKKQIQVIRQIEVELGRLIYGESKQKTPEEPAPANEQHPQAGGVEAKQLEKKKRKIDSLNGATQPDKGKEESMPHDPKRTSPADDAIQQLLRQHQDMMRHMQRQQASHLKTTAAASTDVIQLLFHQNQEFMQHMQQMQASQPAASINADVIQLLIPLIQQNQALMQQASQSPASTSADAVQQLMRQNQAFMQHMQQQQHLQTSQPIININPNISPNINPNISANAGDQVAYAPSAPPTVIAERNNAAFVVGVLGGLFGLLGIAHIFNHKAGRGLVYLFVGTVCYWIFLLFLLTALTNIGSSLWVAAVAIHLVIIWQHAKRGASSASANQAVKTKRK